jgi:hypothetical protein
MTESFRDEDAASERVKLEDGQVEVFFDGSTNEKPASIILDTVKVKNVSYDQSDGIFEYDELIFTNGTILRPVDVLEDKRVAALGLHLEPHILKGFSLLRTIEFRRDMQFLHIVKDETTVSQRDIIRDDLLQNEKARIPGSVKRLTHLFDADESLELWLRLEATNNPDRALVGKTIMARLAFFMSHDSQVGIMPIIYNATDGITTRIPEQLSMHESWLNGELR